MSIVLAEKIEGVLKLTLNRPDKANALSYELITTLLQEVKTGIESKDIKIITLTGTGKAFCAGADRDELMGKVNPPSPKATAGLLHSSADSRPRLFMEADKIAESYVELIETLLSCEKPFLIGVNGPAIGGGLGLAMTGDVVLASETATFQTPETKLGLFPFVISPILISIIGKKRFFEMVYTGQPVGAKKGKTWGMVNQVIPPDSLEKELDQLAKNISEITTTALCRGKRAIGQGLGLKEMGDELAALILKKKR